MGIHIEFIRDEASPETGLVTYYVRVIETDEKEAVVTHGPITALGIEPGALANLNGDYEGWIMSHAPTLVRQYQALRHHAEHAPQMRGKRFKIE